MVEILSFPAFPFIEFSTLKGRKNDHGYWVTYESLVQSRSGFLDLKFMNYESYKDIVSCHTLCMYWDKINKVYTDEL